MKSLTGKVAVITGVGSGIGRALAHELAREGCQVAMNDIHHHTLEETATSVNETYGTKTYTEAFDVADWARMQDFASNVANHFGGVDLVINNAGVALGAYTADEVSIEDFQWLMDINFWGMVYGSKAFLPFLKCRKAASLVNISSILGLAAIARQSAYCASKFAIRGFTESLRMEAMMDFPHVHVLSVHPGGIKTNIARNSKWNQRVFSDEEIQGLTEEFEKSFINTPEYAAKTIIRGVKKRKKRVLIGNDARQMWRFVRWFPTGYSKILIHTFLKKYNFPEEDKNDGDSVSIKT
jgi:butyryl-CoA dehydrogenase